MLYDKETPEERRERLRQEELKHPASSMQGSNLADSVGGLNWKVTATILLLVVVIIIGMFLLGK